MSARNFNNTTTAGTLSAPVSPSDLFLTVAGLTNYPAAPFTVTLDRGQVGEEIVLVTAITVPTLTVTRGYNGTAATTHLAGTIVEHTAVALDFSEANAHVNATDNVHGIVGGLVGDEAPQTLLDKTLISPVFEADVSAGDALVAYVPEGAEVRNLFRGMNPAGEDVFVVDSSGRAIGATATAPEHLIRKSQVDAADAALDGRLDTAEATLAAATAAATVNTVAKRDASGRLAVATPSAAGDAATKGYADGLGVSTPTVSTIARRDAAGRLQVVDPSVAADVATKNYVDGKFSDTDWQDITLPGGVAAGARGAKYRVKNGICYIIWGSNANGYTAGMLVGTLPVGARPPASTAVVASYPNQGVFTELGIATDGTIRVTQAQAGTNIPLTFSATFPVA